MFLTTLLTSLLLAQANPNSNLTCKGTSDAHNMSFEIAVTKVSGNQVKFTNTKTKKICSCTYRLGVYNDLSLGAAPKQITRLLFESCNQECPEDMKKKINASIDVVYEQMAANSFAKPFSGNRAINCSNFNIDTKGLRGLEKERISKLDMPTDVKEKLIDIKGVNN
ncbi:hypothetical protein K2P97_10565 [bacterium]|nr:hypothetical protein [bacterium]